MHMMDLGHKPEQHAPPEVGGQKVYYPSITIRKPKKEAKEYDFEPGDEVDAMVHLKLKGIREEETGDVECTFDVIKLGFEHGKSKSEDETDRHERIKKDYTKEE